MATFGGGGQITNSSQVAANVIALSSLANQTGPVTIGRQAATSGSISALNSGPSGCEILDVQTLSAAAYSKASLDSTNYQFFELWLVGLHAGATATLTFNNDTTSGNYSTSYNVQGNGTSASSTSNAASSGIIIPNQNGAGQPSGMTCIRFGKRAAAGQCAVLIQTTGDTIPMLISGTWNNTSALVTRVDITTTFTGLAVLYGYRTTIPS